MKKLSLLLICCSLIFIDQIQAQESNIFPLGQKAPNINHVGNVFLSELVHPDSTFNFAVAHVVSEAGSRLNWHEHPGGQILFVLDGQGYYQERGRPKQIIKKGDVIKIPPGVVHWHGATAENSVVYMATSPAQKGGTIWHDPIKDEEYFK